MDIVSLAISSFRKNAKLKKISKKLGAPISMDTTLMQSMREQGKALDELYELAKNYKYTDQRLNKYKLGKKKFKKLYKNLILAGAGQWTNGHFVAASTFAFGSTLKYLLSEYKKYKEKDIEGSNPYSDILSYWEELAYNLVEYFDKNKSGDVV